MNATSALGWALIHFLWQGTLIALLARLLLAALPARLASARYAAGLGALVLMPAAVALTAAFGLGRPAPASETPVPSALGVETSALPDAVAANEESAQVAPAAATAAPAARPEVRTGLVSVPWRQRVDDALPWIVGAWAAGALALSTRLIAGYTATRRLRAGHEPVPAHVIGLVARLSVRLGVHRAVRVSCSGLTRVPAVAGWLRPVVLLPASAVTGLAPAQLEAILAHELAHVRRHDYLVNLVQSVIETLLFYHPAVWWLGAQVRAEREHCCDDLAVAACGSAPRYAEALLSMEELRGAPRLAPALTGGSLLARVERLLSPAAGRTESFPRWLAGMSAASIVLACVASSELGAAGAQGRERARQDERELVRQDERVDYRPTRASEVLIAPDAGQSLERRTEWAEAEAARRGQREFWVGHAIASSPRFEKGILRARFDSRGGLKLGNDEDSVTISGLCTIFTDDTQELELPGEPLAPLVGADPADIGILYLCSARGGRTTLQRVHLATARLAVDFEGLPLLWLGRADDKESVQDALRRMDQARTVEQRSDLVAVLGAHATSALVVPELTRILGGKGEDEVRSEAAEWLAYHPDQTALAALDRAARHDRSGDVRREAAEAVSEMRFAPAFDVLCALARELEDSEARSEAVEGFAERTEPGAVLVLEDIANNDRDADIQREAVETLGEVPNGAGLASVAAIARGHVDPDVRREAVETYGECASPDEALTFLTDLVARDPHSDVRCEAVETIGEVRDARVVGVLERIIDGRDDPDVQREAVETLGETIDPAAALPVLERIANGRAGVDVRREACETLGELQDERVPEILERLANSADEQDVQREAVESLGETFLGAQVAPVLERIARRHPDVEIQREAVETLGDLHDDDNHVLDLVTDLAATHPSDEIRVEAIETLADHMKSRQARALFERLLGSERSRLVREALKDALEE